MRRALAVLALAALPHAAASQEGEGGLFDRGVELMLRGLMAEMAPAIRDLEGTMRMLEGVVGQLEQYEAPEVLPNGDIIIRRKREVGPDIAPDGEVEI